MREYVMNTKKRIWFLTLLTAGLLAMMMSVRVHAADLWESESNDVMGSATAIGLNQMVKGTMSSRYDEDWYKFVINQDGYFKIYFAPDQMARKSDIQSGWNIELQDSYRNRLKYYSYVQTDLSSYEIALQKGTYYVRVDSNYSAPTGVIYNMKVNFVADTSWNLDKYYSYETYADAKSITAGKQYTGNIYARYDIDYFLLNTSGNGKLKINFKIDDSVKAGNINSGWSITVRDINRNLIYNKDYIKTSMTTELLDYNGPVYIIIGGAYSAPVECMYHINVTDYPAAKPTAKPAAKKATTTQPTKTSIKKVKAAKGRKAVVTWKRNSKVNGYQIQYSMRKNFKKGVKTKKIRSNATVRYTLKKLKKGTWYVRIRTYKGNKYSSWSKVKKVVIRK